MTATRRPSEAQRNLALRLANDRELPELGSTSAQRVDRVVTLFDVETTFGMRDASQLIDRLFAAPRATAGSVPIGSGDTSGVPTVPTARVGVYRLNDRLYVVRKAKNSDRIYALELVSAPDRLMEDGSVAKLELEYRKGMIFQLTDEHRLPAVEVEQVSRRYGRCLQCGLKLKAAKSVERGIGPVCWKKVS